MLGGNSVGASLPSVASRPRFASSYLRLAGVVPESYSESYPHSLCEPCFSLSPVVVVFHEEKGPLGDVL